MIIRVCSPLAPDWMIARRKAQKRIPKPIQYNKRKIKKTFSALFEMVTNGLLLKRFDDRIVNHSDKQNGIKYDLIVKPHADPNQIKLSENELLIKVHAFPINPLDILKINKVLRC